MLVFAEIQNSFSLSCKPKPTGLDIQGRSRGKGRCIDCNRWNKLENLQEMLQN